MATGLWSVYAPEAGDNILSNPSLETNATSWTLIGATLTRTMAKPALGDYSLLVDPNNAAAGEGGYHANVVTTPSTSYTASVYVRAEGANAAVTLALDERTSGDAEVGETTTSGTATSTAWTRLTVTRAFGATGARGRVIVRTTSQHGNHFYIDGAQLEAKAYVTSFIDGDQPGCLWNGYPHGSASSRNAQYRAGGKLVNLRDYCGVAERGMISVGMPPLRSWDSSYATMPGGEYLGSLAEMREFTLVLMVMGSRAVRQAARAKLKALFDPLLTDPTQPLRLVYTGSASTLEIDAVYVDGLEGTFHASETSETIPVRLRAHDPNFYESVQESALSAAHERKTLSLCLVDDRGIYSNLSATLGTTGNVYALCATPDYLYIGGSFVDVGDPNGDYIVRYNWATGAISSMGTGLQGGDCKALYWDGTNLIAGGAFTGAGSVASTRGIAKWNGSAWSALGTGLNNGLVYCVEGDLSTGKFAIGGTFTQVGSVASTKGIAEWSGAAWTALTDGTLTAQGGTGPDIRAICAYGGEYWVSGFFSIIDDQTVNNLAHYDGSSWRNIGSINVAGHAWSIIRGSDGTIYLGGENISAIGGISGTGLWIYDGATWKVVFNTAVVIYRLRYWDGEVWIAGDRIASDTRSYAVQVYTGGALIGRPTDIPGVGGSVRDLVRWGAKRYVGIVGSGACWSSKRLTVTNGGTALAYPRFRLPFETGSTGATPMLIVNETTGKLLWLDAAALVSGTYLDVDLDYRPDPLVKGRPPGRKRISNPFYDSLSAILRGSNLGTFGLVRGVNDLTIYTGEDPAETTPTNVSVTWRVPHGAIDE